MRSSSRHPCLGVGGLGRALTSSLPDTPLQLLEILHDRLLRGAGDHDHRLLIGVSVGLDVMDEWRHVYVVAGLGSQSHLVPAVRIDELGTARHDVDAGFAFAMVMRSGSNARRDARF